MSQEHLTQAFESLNQRLSSLETTNQNLATRNQELAAQLAAAPPPPAQAQVSAPKPPKLNPPTPFDGKAANFRTFMTQLTTVFQIQAASFVDDQIKIMYCYSYLSGRASLWATPIIEEPQRHALIRASWEAFKAALATTFGPVDQATTSAAAIRNLTQRGSVVEYVAQFNILASDLTWNDEALTSQFRSGLSSDIKDLALSVDEPATLALWTVLAIRLDNRLTERRQERMAINPRASNPRNPNAPAHQPALAPRAPVLPAANDRMDLDAMQAAGRPRGPLTEVERERRYRERLCLYCAGADHIRVNCPVAPRRRAQVAAMNAPRQPAEAPAQPAIVPALPQNPPAQQGFQGGQ